MKKELKFKLELGKLYKWFIVFMCFFGIILSIYLFFTPVYIQENPKLTYLCPIAVVLCIVGLFYPFKYKIKVFTTSVEYNNVFTNKIIDFNQVNKLRLSNYRTLRVVGNETKIELTNDLRNQKKSKGSN